MDSTTSVWSALCEKVVEILLTHITEGVPVYHLLIESGLLLILVIVYLRPRKAAKDPTEILSKREEDALVKDWIPDSLVEDSAKSNDDGVLDIRRVISSAVGTHVTINGSSKLNLGTFNFLGFVGHKEIEDTSVAAARRYGIGSCGPRGFYGTIDCHLELEKQLADFMGAEEAILYSYGFSTISSVIPAYCKRGDVIFYDKSISFAIQKGLVASRSQLIGFEHNDMADLERLLIEQENVDKKDPKKAAVTRKFIVVEGLYEYTGDIAPLDKLVDLKFKYKVRLFLEESMSFGVLGKTGKGITEHFGIPFEKIDAVAAGLGNALGSIGGFACGRSYVIDHQRLSGAGYVYSASLPPLLASAAIKALSMIVEANGDYQNRVSSNTAAVHAQAQNIEGLTLCGLPNSPVMHLRLTDSDIPRQEQQQVLDRIVQRCLDDGVALVQPRYIVDQEFHPPLPSIRLGVSAAHTPKELKNALNLLSQHTAQVLDIAKTNTPKTPEVTRTRPTTRSHGKKKR